MNESPDKRKRKLNRSLVAGAAMLAGISTAEANGTNIDRMQTAETHDVLDTEASILSDSMPLNEQIRFLEDALKEGGVYARQLNSIRLSPAQLSKIFRIANTVSARLTNAYTERPDDPDLRQYFSVVDVLRNVTSQYRIERASGAEVCNKYLVRDGGQVFEVTAFHCIKNSPYEQRFFHPDGTEIAVNKLSEQEAAQRVSDLNAIPAVNPGATPENINGKVVVAFSWGRRGEAKPHFSVAMPMPARNSLVFSDKERFELGPYGIPRMNVFFKPFAEGLRNPETRRLNVSGSSGGPMYAVGLGILGNYSATKEVSDKCINVCYATSFFSGPEVLQMAIQGEREWRAVNKSKKE